MKKISLFLIVVLIFSIFATITFAANPIVNQFSLGQNFGGWIITTKTPPGVECSEGKFLIVSGKQSQSGIGMLILNSSKKVGKNDPKAMNAILGKRERTPSLSYCKLKINDIEIPYPVYVITLYGTGTAK